jgi:hypothetical protein
VPSYSFRPKAGVPPIVEGEKPPAPPPPTTLIKRAGKEEEGSKHKEYYMPEDLRARMIHRSMEVLRKNEVSVCVRIAIHIYLHMKRSIMRLFVTSLFFLLAISSQEEAARVESITKANAARLKHDDLKKNHQEEAFQLKKKIACGKSLDLKQQQQQ